MSSRRCTHDRYSSRFRNKILNRHVIADLGEQPQPHERERHGVAQPVLREVESRRLLLGGESAHSFCATSSLRTSERSSRGGYFLVAKARTPSVPRHLYAPPRGRVARAVTREAARDGRAARRHRRAREERTRGKGEGEARRRVRGARGGNGEHEARSASPREEQDGNGDRRSASPREEV